jgi:outer membrane protein
MNVVKPYLVKTVAVVALVFSLSISAEAQEVKIGVVNIPLLMEQAPQARVAMEALDEEFQPRQREIVARQTEFQELTEKVQRDLAVMGETERRNAEKNCATCNAK